MKNEILFPLPPKVLQHFSQEHRVIALLSMRIRIGFKKEIELDRIKKYTDWIFKTQIKPHFEDEEKHALSILEDNDRIKKRTLAEHRKLERLFNEDTDINRSLNLIEELLDLHIRFEERTLFRHIQKLVSIEQLKKLNENNKPPLREAFWEDRFWE